tara:strand:- start:1129 stop:2331 length:1203 start_codon:yes stop_codon:yes gene_type:complete
MYKFVSTWSKSKKKYLVFLKDKNNKRTTSYYDPNKKQIIKLQKFLENQRRELKDYIDVLNKYVSSNVYSTVEEYNNTLETFGNITILNAFKKYKKKVLGDKLNRYYTNENYISNLENHLINHIENKLLQDYKAIDFETIILNAVLNSRSSKACTVCKKKHTMSKKVIKDTVAVFKRFVMYCDECDFDLNNKFFTKVIGFKFKRNFFDNLKNCQQEKYCPLPFEVKKIINGENNLIDKFLYRHSAETGTRPGETLGILHEDINVSNKTIFINHSLDQRGFWQRGKLKNKNSKRSIAVSDKYIVLYQMAFPIKNPKERVFNNTRDVVTLKIKNAAKKNGVDWVGGLKPFRKFSSSLARESKLFTKDQFVKRFGWVDDVVFDDHYAKDLMDNKEKQRELLNNL